MVLPRSRRRDAVELAGIVSLTAGCDRGRPAQRLQRRSRSEKAHLKRRGITSHTQFVAFCEQQVISFYARKRFYVDRAIVLRHDS